MEQNINSRVSEAVRVALKKAAKSQAWLAEEMGIYPGYLSELINEKNGKQWNAQTMQAAFSALSIDFSDFDESSSVINGNKKITVHNIKVIGSIQAGTWRESRQWEPEYWESAMFDLKNNEKNAYGLRVSGDSMDEYYKEGTIVVVQPLHDCETIESGDHVIVERCRGGDIYETTIKELVIDGDKAELWPRSSNPKYKEPVCLFWPYDKRQQHGVETVEIKGVVIGSINRRKR